MASIRKRGNSWVADVCVNLKRQSKSFATKKEAVTWANEQEEDGILARHTLKEAIAKYRPIAEKMKGHQAKLSRLKTLESSDLAILPLEYITPAKLADYRDKRANQVSEGSTRIELILLSTIFKLCVEEWGWLRRNPAQSVKKPPIKPPRMRGVTAGEIEEIMANLDKQRVGKQVSALFELSLETGMRLSEITGLKWPQVSEKFVTLPDTKNGDSRNVPLSQRAREIIDARKGIDPDDVFTVSASIASKSFQRASVNGVHFHDARSEAITRLSKKLDVMQLAKMIGHRDLQSLMIYYAEKAEDIADRL